MPEVSGDPAAQVANGAQAQVATQTSAQDAGAQSSQADGATTGSGTEGTPQSQSEIAALRRENASYRTRVRELERVQAQAAAASMTDLERANARVAELERLNADALIREQDRTVRLSAIEEATRLNFRSPDLAYRLIDRAEIDFDDAGTPKNIAKLLEGILKREPYLVKGSTADFGGGNRGGSPQGIDMNQIIRRAAGRT